MRRFCSIFLLTIYLATSTEAHELANLPSLFTHFHEHQGLDNTITFLDFLTLHYIGTHNDQTHHHERLPFKKEHCEAIHMPLALVPDMAVAEFSSRTQSKKIAVIYLSQFHLSDLPGGIWQPPKQS